MTNENKTRCSVAIQRKRFTLGTKGVGVMVAVCAVFSMLFGSTQAAFGQPDWDTETTTLGNPTDYHLPEYPLAFVGAKINEIPLGDTGVEGFYHIGTDVLSANNPDAGHHLWLLRTNGLVDKLFPLPIHQASPQFEDLIDTPFGLLERGTVLEPNVSEDGKRLYFSYVHDATVEAVHNYGLKDLPLSGADLYAIDLAPLLADPNFPLDQLEPYRLTSRTADDEYAMNQTAVGDAGVNDWGTTHMHAVEMRTKDGLKLVYASDKRRLDNSNKNFSLGVANHNFNLHIADLVETSEGPVLENSRQFHYYTTTSAMSPTPLRDGVAFSYQASTAEPRQWQIQATDSVGVWSPLLGYGANQELVHLGTLCVSNLGGIDDEDPDLPTSSFLPGDYFIAARYYNANNEGFGALHRISLDPTTLGKNTYDNQIGTHGARPEQVGNKIITLDAISADDPSLPHPVPGPYIGKFTSPRCGKPDELYAAYTPTSANGRLLDLQGNKNIYHSYITYRPTLEEFRPLSEQKIVVRDLSDTYTLVWPTPILSWLERTGTDTQQSYTDSVIKPGSGIKAGLPHARVGTSSLDNTDRKPFDCWLEVGGAPYLPSKHASGGSNFAIQVVKNQDGLTRVFDQSDWCADLVPEKVFGVAVQLTSNKLDADFGFAPGYETGGYERSKEIAKLLGVIDVRGQMNAGGELDTSFEALIPARVPFEFHLLDAEFGLRLTDVRSWHSLQPRETRTNCGGCHQHDYNKAPVDFSGTVADLNPPTDFVTATPYVDYDANCLPILVDNPGQAALGLPEWNADIWETFDDTCGNCHKMGGSPPPGQNGKGAFSYSDSATAYDELQSKYYAFPVSGALGSPAFWAARGMRTDGRDPALYTGSSPNFSFDGVHTTEVGLCDGSDPTGAQWVYKFGLWIDNHMPMDFASEKYNYGYDRFHPTLDFALTKKNCAANEVRIGYWDDSGSIDKLEVLVDGTPDGPTLASLNNGSTIHNFGTTLTGSQSVSVIVTDVADNRQIYTKSVRELKDECVPKRVEIDPVPFP